MSKRSQNPDALSDDEIAFLRSDRAPSTVRSFVARQHETVGTRTSAYRKVAAAARAERDALLEVAALELVRAASGEREATAEDVRVQALQAQREQMAAELESLRQRLMQATALPAMAVSSEGTGR